jgi:hypothetical protein
MAYHKQKERHFYGRLAAGKSVSIHVIKTYVGADPIASFTKLDKAWRRVLSFTSQPLSHQEKRFQHPLNRKVSGTLGRSENFGEEKNRMNLLGFERRLYGCHLVY